MEIEKEIQGTFGCCFCSNSIYNSSIYHIDNESSPDDETWLCIDCINKIKEHDFGDKMLKAVSEIKEETETDKPIIPIEIIAPEYMKPKLIRIETRDKLYIELTTVLYTHDIELKVTRPVLTLSDLKPGDCFEYDDCKFQKLAGIYAGRLGVLCSDYKTGELPNEIQVARISIEEFKND